MKNISVVLLGFVVFLSCNQAPVEQANLKEVKIEKQIEPTNTLEIKDVHFDFEKDKVGRLPKNWSQAFTGRGDATEWKVVDDNGNHVLAQLSTNNPNYHFNVVVFDELNLDYVIMAVRLKAVAGKMDQGGGFVWRYKDANNYYVVRANPLEDNVVLYKVVDGKRTDLPVLGKGRTYGVDVPKLGNDWFDLSVEVDSDLFTVYLNSKELFQVKDQSISGVGKIGLWTKADAVTYFDDFRVHLSL